MSSDPALFNLEQNKRSEAARRLRLLGTLAAQPFDYDLFYDRAFAVRVPLNVLKQWHHQFQNSGIDGLLPNDWTELNAHERHVACERYLQLREFVDKDIVDGAIEVDLAAKMRCSLRTADRWIKRYRIGGLWGLAPRFNPLDTHIEKPAISPPRAIGTFDEATLATVYQRLQMLEGLVEHEHTSDASVTARATEVGVSKRTLWNYLRDYRKYGLAGLAPKERSDKDSRHAISEHVIEMVQGIRLAHPNWRVRAVYEMTCARVRDLGEIPPSEWQVRDICQRIPAPIRLIADGRENEFRNRYRISYPMQFNGVVYQLDHTLVDVLVRDLRSKRYQTPSGEIRPWLTLVIDSCSRVVVAAKFAYDRPNRHTVAGVIRHALLAQPGGIPHEIWVDNGKDLIARHVQELTREMGIQLHPCAPHQPQQRGICERFFGTLNTRLWSLLPGYVASNTVERNPKAQAELTINDLEQRFWQFLAQYHQEPHSELGVTPLAYWDEHCFAQPVPDERRLDTLLLETMTRNVNKTGIKYDGRVYWHAELATVVGTEVLIRTDTAYESPDEVEVYHDGRWFCTAFAVDSEHGRSVTRTEVAEAQKEQRAWARQQINAAKTRLQNVEREINTTAQVTPQPEVQAPQNATDEPPTVSSSECKRKRVDQSRKSRKMDLLEQLGEEGD